MVNKKRVSKVLVFVLLIGTLLSSVAFAADVDTTDWVVAEDIKIKTTAHIQKDGDKDFSGNGQIWFGTTGEKKRVEEISIGLEGEVPEDMRIMYMAHVQTYGDTKWTEGPNPAGTHGEAKRIEGIAIKLVDEAGKEYPGYVAEYQVHMAQYGWGINETKNDKKDDNKINDSYKEWASNGTYAGTRGGARRIEAVRLRIRREDELKVKSVSAINAEEILVTFSKDVNKASTGAGAGNTANYELKVNNTVKGIEDIKVDGKTALIRVSSPFTLGDKYTLQVRDAIKAVDGDNVERYTTEALSFTASAAPKLAKVELGTDKLVLTFDRPINVASPTLIKLDEVALTAPNWTADDANEAGNYKYTVDLATTAEKNLAKEEGKHEVVIFDAAETAVNNPAKASFLTGTYTVTKDTTAPKVVGLTAINSNKFFIELNKAAEGVTPKIVVNKGTHEFPVNTISEDSGATIDPSAGAGSELYAQAGTYKLNPGYYVVISDKKVGNENPLYRTGETSVKLDVEFSNFKETGSSLLGEKYTGTITLSKELVKPEIEKAEIDSTNLKVTFKGELKDAPALSDVVVRDKDGVIITPSAAITLSTDVVTIPLSDVDDEPYTIEFKKDAVTYAEHLTTVAGYALESEGNDALTVIATTGGTTNFKYEEITLDATPTTGNVVVSSDNVIDIDYGVKMDDSARNVANYTLDGKALPSGSTVDFFGDKENVRITLPKETIKASTDYKLTVSTNVRTADNKIVVDSIQTKAAADVVISLTDNVKPVLKSAKFINIDTDGLTDKIELTFSEAITVIDNSSDFDDLLVKVVGNKVAYNAINADDAANGKIVITLASVVNTSQKTTITVVEEGDDNATVNFEDNDNNPLAAGTVTVTK